MKGRVVVRLNPEVSDPEGEAIARKLADLGFEGVRSVRQGKLFEFEFDQDDADKEDLAAAHSMLVKVSRQLLIDPETEDFRIKVTGGEEDSGSGGDRRGAKRRDSERRDQDDRRTGGDRRAEAAAARGESAEYERRKGDERRGDDERRHDDRRTHSDRRSGTERRTGDDRRTGDERRHDDTGEFEGPDRRRGERRHDERREHGK